MGRFLKKNDPSYAHFRKSTGWTVRRVAPAIFWAGCVIPSPPSEFESRGGGRDGNVTGGEYVPSLELHVRDEGAEDGEGHFRR